MRRKRWKEDIFYNLHIKENEIEMWMNWEEREWLNEIFDERIQSDERLSER